MRAFAALLCFAAACERSETRPIDDLPTAIAVDSDHALLATGPVGTTERQPGTYVYVDVKNGSDKDRMVGVDGALVDANGKELARLHVDQMRVPRQGIRTFALVSTTPAPDAARATYRVVRADAVSYPAEVDVEAPQTSRQGEMLVAAGWAKNHEKRAASAVVTATFYGPDGKILSRPFTIVALGPGEKRPVRFEGPGTAVEATLNIGEIVFN